MAFKRNNTTVLGLHIISVAQATEMLKGWNSYKKLFGGGQYIIYCLAWIYFCPSVQNNLYYMQNKDGKVLSNVNQGFLIKHARFL